MALNVAVSASLAVERVGLPEAQIILAQAVSYVACAPKSNAACVAIFAAKEEVQKRGICPFRRICRMRITKARRSWDTGQDINMHMTIKSLCRTAVSSI